MRATYWHSSDEHPIKDLIFDVAGTYPLDEQCLHDALDEDDDVIDALTKEAGVSASPMVWMLVRLEDEFGVQLSDDFSERVMADEVSVGELCDFFDRHQKEAEISTPEERARAAQYRAAHQEELRRKARKRRQLIAKGVKQKMRRIGTAATGYTYVADTAHGDGGSARANVGGLASHFNFNPSRDTQPTQDASTLRWK